MAYIENTQASQRGSSRILGDPGAVSRVGKGVTCDQAFFFFFFFKGGRERHKGIIGRGHDLRLEKAGRKFASTGKRATGYRLSPNCFQKFKQMPAPDWAQKMLCIIVPNRRTVFTEFFLWVRTPRLLFRSRLVWLMHQRNARSQSCILI